jgi:hypothetical protein
MSVKVSKDQALASATLMFSCCRRPLGEGWSNNFVVPPRLGVHDVSQYSCQVHVPQHEPLSSTRQPQCPQETKRTTRSSTVTSSILSIDMGIKILSPTYKCGLHNPSWMRHNQLPIQFLQLPATAKTVRFEHHMLSSH